MNYRSKEVNGPIALILVPTRELATQICEEIRSFTNLINIETIKNYLSSKKIIGLHVFIIETEKLKYCFDTINQLQGILNDFSFCLSDNDLITPSKILESTKYSFINEEICKYFKIHNTNDFSKVFLFVNKKSNNGRDIFIYFEHKYNLLN